MPISLRPKGMSLLGIVMAIGVLGALSLAIPVFVASNQSMRSQVLYTAQAFYSSHALFEYQMRQIKVGGGSCGGTAQTKYFLGSPLASNRTGNKINAAITYKGAASNFSINDPVVSSMAKGMYFDTSKANLTGNQTQLKHVHFGRLPNCLATLSIVSLTVSWEPNGGSSEKITAVKIDNDVYYSNSTGLTNGSTIPLSTPYIVDDFSERCIAEITMTHGPYGTYTFGFNMSDGSTITLSGNVVE